MVKLLHTRLKRLSAIVLSTVMLISLFTGLAFTNQIVSASSTVLQFGGSDPDIVLTDVDSTGTTDTTTFAIDGVGWDLARIRARNIGEYAKYEFSVAEAGTYALELQAIGHKYGGVGSISINGTSVGEQSYYSNPITVLQPNFLGVIELNEGTNEITFTSTELIGDGDPPWGQMYNSTLTVEKTNPPLIKDSFDQNTTEEFPAGWENITDTAGIPVTVEEFPSVSDKSVKISKPAAGSSQNRIRKTFDPVSEVLTISVDLFVEEKISFNQLNIMSGSSRPLRLVLRHDNNDLFIYNGSASTLVGFTYEADEWFNVRFVIDPTKQTYDFYIEGKLQAHGLEFIGDETEITGIDFHTSNGIVDASTMYINNVLATKGGKMVVGDAFGHEFGPVILGEPTGGGEGYSDIIDPADADYIVNDKDTFLSALDQAQAGDVIYVDDNAAIDLTSLGTTPANIPAGVTLASGRGRDASQGGLIFTDYYKGEEPDMESGYTNRMKQHWIDGLLTADGPDVRITGLRIQGNDGETNLDTPGFRTYMLPVSTGIYSKYNIEVDNNEIYDWSFNGVRTGDGHIHHNHIHHTWRTGLGYNISLDFMPEGDLLIEGNILEKFRHAIAGMGAPSDGYIARYNWVGEGISFAFDMHTNREGDSAHGADGGTYIAGDEMIIEYNTFTDLANRAVTIRGVPVEGVYIDKNWFHRPLEEGYEVVQQRNSYGNFFVGENAYGPEQEVYEGHPPPVAPTVSLTSLTLKDVLGNEVTDPQANQSVQIKASVRNTNYYTGEARLISVVKDTSGTVHAMTQSGQGIDQRTSAVFNSAMTMPDNMEGMSLGHYLWNSIEKMQPTNGYKTEGTLAVEAEITESELQISGSTSNGPDRKVTLLVVDPQGKLVFIDEVTSEENGLYSIAFDLNQGAEGEYVVKAGGEGITAPQTATVLYDKTAPEAPVIVSPKTVQTTSDNTPEIVIAAEAGALIEILLDDQVVGSGIGAGNEPVTITLEALPVGNNRLSVIATDASDNQSEKVDLPHININKGDTTSS